MILVNRSNCLKKASEAAETADKVANQEGKFNKTEAELMINAVQMHTRRAEAWAAIAQACK